MPGWQHRLRDCGRFECVRAGTGADFEHERRQLRVWSFRHLQYPFQFWLPFTSLNKQRILLKASARVRMENQ
jgi:hypothetical protein